MSREDDANPGVEGTVVDLLPSALYRVVLDGGHRVTAHLGRGSTRNFVRVLVGDRVLVKLAPRDRTRGRIVSKL